MPKQVSKSWGKSWSFSWSKSTSSCRNCGARISGGSAFCNRCGARQATVPQETSQEPTLPRGPAPPAVADRPQVPAVVPQDLKCVSCGADLKPATGLALVVCEYCGATTTMGAAGVAEIFQRHFMLDNRLSREDAVASGGKWLDKGIFRRNVAERSELGQVTLRYVPYWIVPVSVTANFQGSKVVGKDSQGRDRVASIRDRIQLQKTIPVVAVRGYTRFQPKEGFQFHLENKVTFERRETGGIEVQNGDISEAEAKKGAEAFASKLAEEEADSRVDSLASIQVYPTAYDSDLVHVPVWFMQYTHKGKPMFILVDGHSGDVVNGERPLVSLW